jgi:hypothetical protein
VPRSFTEEDILLPAVGERKNGKDSDDDEANLNEENNTVVTYEQFAKA